MAANIAFVQLGLMNPFTIEQQNKILSLVTTFSSRRRGDEYKMPQMRER